MTVTAIPATKDGASAKDATGTKEKGSKKKLIIILVAVLALAGGGYEMFLKPPPSGPPKPGDVMTLDAIQINLEGDHYLRLGLALQLVKGVKTEDGSKALDAAIDIFSGLPMAEVNNGTKREQLKTELVSELGKRYDHEVMGVYFTELVTQ
ncbi:MAG TPA: flagellar basal body-associated FliL family protein [Marmoricola sp.]|jgi:flagellar FliL protein|nr:flagellar basal body-associated FliL family protein [Marmoricola sp.]